MAKRAKTDVIQLKLRMREELRARLAADAKAHKLSLNSEIVKRLEASFDAVTREAFLNLRDEFTGFLRLLSQERETRERKARERK